MKKKVLVSWLGTRDIIELVKMESGGTPACALTSLVSSGFGPFDEVYLFYSHDEPEDEEKIRNCEIAINALTQICRSYNTKVIRRPAGKNARAFSPEKLYAFSIKALDERFENPDNWQFYYNITSGTAIMGNIQFYLSQNGMFRGDALYTIDPHWLPPDSKSSLANVYLAALPTALTQLEARETAQADLYMEPNRKIYDQIALKVAPTDASILILGETGVGKTELAKYVHKLDSRRCKKPFVEVNCAMFSDNSDSLRSELFGHVKGSYTGAIKDRQGKFKDADGGILFLDEIGELPLALQGQLLRALDKDGMITPLGSNDDIKVDVRVIAATNVDLEKAVNEGRFRKDLYYRLAQYAPRLKALKDYTRKEKETLLMKLLAAINKDAHRKEPRTLSPEAHDLLMQYSWPGNIREMKYRLRSICLLSDAVVTGDDVREQVKVTEAAGSDSQHAPVFACGQMSGHVAEEEIPHNLQDWLSDLESYWLQEAAYHHPLQKDAAKRLGLKTSTFNTKYARFKSSQR